MTASNLPLAGQPHSATAHRRDGASARWLEPLGLGSLQRGRCDWCGGKCSRGRSYCSPACRVAYNNLLTRQGKALVQSLKLWRLHRGRAGTRGAGKLTLVSARVDQLLAEDRARWQEAGNG